MELRAEEQMFGLKLRVYRSKEEENVRNLRDWRKSLEQFNGINAIEERRNYRKSWRQEE